MDFERGFNQPELTQRWTRGGSMRIAQVLPDKKVRRDKNNSIENIASAVADLSLNDSAAASASATTGATSPAFIPRPPVAKRPSTDSDDNSAPELAAAAAAPVSTSLPPRRQNWMPKKKPPRAEASPSRADHNLLFIARPDDSSDADSPTEDCTSATVVPGASDSSDTSPKGSVVGVASGTTVIASSLRPRSNSLEILVTENHTVPQIRQPQRRVRHARMPADGSSASAMPTGSPPKSVSWQLPPDVVSYDIPESNGGSSSSSRRQRHNRNKSDIPFGAGRGSPYKIRHAASDEKIYDSRKGIANR